MLIDFYKSSSLEFHSLMEEGIHDFFLSDTSSIEGH